jgi:transcriptional regulator with XRE-family HTH domain
MSNVIVCDVQDIRLSEPSQLWRKEDTLALLQRIEDALHWRRVSKSELAGLLGVRKATVTQWFTKARLPDTDVFLSIQRVLGGDGNWWMGIEPGTPPERVPLPLPKVGAKGAKPAPRKGGKPGVANGL